MTVNRKQKSIFTYFYKKNKVKMLFFAITCPKLRTGLRRVAHHQIERAGRDFAETAVAV